MDFLSHIIYENTLEANKKFTSWKFLTKHLETENILVEILKNIIFLRPSVAGKLVFVSQGPAHMLSLKA